MIYADIIAESSGGCARKTKYSYESFGQKFLVLDHVNNDVMFSTSNNISFQIILYVILQVLV